MGSNMETESSTTPMEIYTRDSSPMAWLRDMVSICGQMGPSLLVISNKATGTGMESGNPKVENNNTRVITCWIGNMDMGSTIGEITRFIKANIWKICERGKASCIVMAPLFILGYGKMGNGQKISIKK